jgi:hypothetical protein
MKKNKLLLYIAAGLLLASLGCLVFSFSIPAQTQVNTVRVSYEHDGKFDYVAYLKPSYLLGPEPPPTETATPAPPPSPTPQSPLKYPADMIDRINFTLSYNLTILQASPAVDQRVTAAISGVNKENKPFKFEFAPVALDGPSSAVLFPLFLDDNLSGGDIVIVFSVYPAIYTENGPIFESFSQSISLKREGSVLSIKREDLDKKVSGYTGDLRYLQTGKIDLSVLFKKDSVLGATEVTPPAVPPPIPYTTPAPQPVPLREIRPGNTLYSKLVDRIDASFQYRLQGAAAIRNLDEVASISAVIDASKSWSKTLVITPPRHENGAFTLPFSIDLNRYKALIQAIQTETGASAETYQLTIRADVHTTGETDYGKVDEVFSPTLTTTLDKNTLEWAEKMSQSKPGSIETHETVPNTARYLGLSGTGFRVLFLILTLVFLGIAVLLLLKEMRRRPAPLATTNREAQQYQKKYGQRMAEADGYVSIDTASVIRLNSMEDLIKIADELGKPVVHQSQEAGRHTYQVLDGVTSYEFLLNHTNQDESIPEEKPPESDQEQDPPATN